MVVCRLLSGVYMEVYIWLANSCPVWEESESLARPCDSHKQNMSINNSHKQTRSLN